MSFSLKDIKKWGLLKRGAATAADVGAMPATMTGLQTVIDGGSAAEKAALSSSVSGDGGSRYIGTRMLTSAGGSFSPSQSFVWSMVVALPCEYVALRPVFLSGLSAGVTNVSIAAASSPVRTATGDGLDFTFAGWGGASTGTIPGNGSSDVPLMSTPTDWIYVESMERTDIPGAPYLAVLRISTPISGNPALWLTGPGVVDSGWDAPADGYDYALRFAPGEQVDISMSGAGNPYSSPISGVQFISKSGVRTVAWLGDSITAGLTSTPVCRSFAHIATAQLSSPSAPYVCANLGTSGQNTEQIARKAALYLPVLNPSIVVAPTGSPNDGPVTNSERASRRRGNVRKIISSAKAVGARCIFWGELPRSTDASNTASAYSADEDNGRISTTADNLAPQAVSVDTSSMQSSGASPKKWAVTAHTSDGTHLTLAGDEAMAGLILPHL